MLFFISVGLFTAAVSMSLIAYKREYQSSPLRLDKHSHPPKPTTIFSKGDQILLEQQHWFINKIARAGDGVKSMSIAVLDEPGLFWVVLGSKDHKIINGFYTENINIEKKRVFTDSFSLEDTNYNLNFKTRMASQNQGCGLWADAQSFDVIVYEDTHKKCFFIQIISDDKSCYLQGDNFANDKAIFLSNN